MVPWREAGGEILLTEAQLIAFEPAGAYAVGRNPEGEIQANDLVRGGLAWKKTGRDFALHTSAGRVAIRQEGGSVTLLRRCDRGGSCSNRSLRMPI